MDNSEVNTLLCGQKGLFILEKAMEIAEDILGTKKLATHPDFLLVQSQKALGVEEAELILEKAATVPRDAKNMVILVDSLDSMSVPAQNKLLKFVEDDNHAILIGTAYSKGVIQTLRSRMHCLEFSAYSREEFSRYLAAKGLADEDTLYYVTGGCPGLLEQDIIWDIVKIFQAVSGAMKGNGDLMDVLGLVKEKDNDCFFKLYREYIPQLYIYIGQQLMDGQVYSDSLYSKIITLHEHLDICREEYYTIECFFEAMAKISKKEETVRT